MHLSMHPIWSWPFVAVIATVVAGAVVWIYATTLSGQTGRWRWLVFVLRVVALLLALAPLVRPALVYTEKRKQSASLIVLYDRSRSMLVADAWDNLTRWQAMKQKVQDSKEPLEQLAELLEIRQYQFDSKLHETVNWLEPPSGGSTAIGDVLNESVRSVPGRVAAVVLVSDGANLSGTPPLAVAQRLKDQGVPVFTVGIGQEVALAESRDLALRSLTAGPVVFEKNKLVAGAELHARGFAGQKVNLRLLFDGLHADAGTSDLPPADGSQRVELSYVPTVPGEHKVTMVVGELEPKKGELVETNNEISTYVTVLKGGLRVLYLDGGFGSWEPKYVRWSLDKSPDIQVDFVSVRTPEALARAAEGAAPLFDRLRYDVVLVRDVPRDWIPDRAIEQLAKAVDAGAGLAMLGGRRSFGPGGYAGTPLADVLPVTMLPGDPQLPGPLKVVPTAEGLVHFVMRLGSEAETPQIWRTLEPLEGASSFTRVKERARVLAESPDGAPLVVAQDFGQGRTMALAGDSTWLWYRQSDEGLKQHRRFWRQVILWLARKEQAGENRVWAELAKRRVAAGESLDLAVGADDEQGQPVLDADFEVAITPPDGQPVPLQVLPQGDRRRGTFWGTDKAGDYQVSVIARRGGQELGSTLVKFLVYEDDTEMASPAADLTLLRQIAELTGGKYVQPERLSAFFDELRDQDLGLQIERLTHYRLWDNWYFFLAFVALLTAEWAVRKWKGLV